jgi:hypothetical protein
VMSLILKYLNICRSTDPKKWVLLFDNELTVYFAFLNSLWAVFFCEFLKRRMSYYAVKWHVFDHYAHDHKRVEFVPTIMIQSPITSKFESSFPSSSRHLRQLGSFGISLCFIGLVSLGLIGQIVFMIWLQWLNLNTVLVSFLTGLLAIIVILILRHFYRKVAKALTEWENYKFQSQYDFAFVCKTWIFEFFNIYSYIIF